MRAFAALYRVLDASTFSLAKQASLQRYLHAVPLQDPASAVYCLGGGRSPRRWRRLAGSTPVQSQG